MLANKELDILDYISTTSSPISIADLCEQFNLSPRSIRNYMDNLIVELGVSKIRLDKGLYYVQNHQALLDYLSDPAILFQSSKLKKLMMQYTLVFEEKINLTSMSKTLELSRTSTKIYLNEVMQNFSVYQVKLEPKEQKGLFLIADEETLRKIQLQTLLDHHSLSTTQQELLYPWIKPLFECVSETTLDLFLKHVQKKLNTILSEYSYIIVKHYLRVMIHRTGRKHLIEIQLDDLFVIDSKEFESIQECIHILEEATDIMISNDEIVKLTSLLIGSHYSYSSELKENTWFEHNLLITKIISLYSQYSNINLNQDVQLYQSLMTHLRPTMYRLLHNIKLSDINTPEISTRFKTEYAITKKVLNELNFFTNTTIDQDEIALLTLHFKAAMMRDQSSRSQSKKVLIVCSNGYGTSLLLEQQISSVYDVEVVACIPLHFLPHYQDQDDLDLIITTIPQLTFEGNTPIIYVQPILSSEDFKLLDQNFILQRKNLLSLQKLLDVITDVATIPNVEALKGRLLEQLGDRLFNDTIQSQLSLVRFLPLENIKILDEVVDWKQAIQTGGNILVKNGFVQKSYVAAMQESFENYGSYMMLDEGIAIPHARNEDNVLLTGISLVILRKPVTFSDGRLIHTFFSFCSKDHQEHLDALVAISNLVRESDFKERIPQFTEESELLFFILSHAT